MAATKRDRSGVFGPNWSGRPTTQQASVLDQQFHLSQHGITFVSDTALAEWTEVGIQMKIPERGVRSQHQIDCRGVVVQCTRRRRARGFDVALLFLDLPKGAQAHLVQSAALTPSRISISR